MSNDDTAIRNLGHEGGERLGNVFIREPMEPVAPNALLVELIGYRVAVRDVVMAAMKGRVEAGNLRSSGKLARTVLIDARLCGWCNGASGIKRSSRATTLWSIRTGRS